MQDTKKCPYCAEEIKAEAKKCRFCGEFLEVEKENVGKINNSSQLNTIECPSCHGKVIPSVHLVPAEIFPKARYAKNQHICPNCGYLIFEDGGKFTKSALIALSIFIIWFFIAIIVAVNS